jgi:site-specific recombinase XerD
MMINKGADIYTLSRVMGHGSITITTDTYGHLYDDKRRALIKLFD